MTIAIIASRLFCHSSFVFGLSHLLFLSGHYVRQATEVIGHQLHLIGKWPMADCYIEPW